MTRIACIALAATFFALALAAAPASAAVTCSYDGTARLLTVEMSAASDTVLFTRNAAGAISAIPATCTGGPTVTNTDNILVNDNSSGATQVDILQPDGFGPGFQADEDAVAEIEFVLNLGPGFDQIGMEGTAGPARIHVGSGGVNFNAAPGDGDADITYISGPPDRLFLDGGAGEDLLTGQGGAGAGAPFATGTVTLDGQGGNDTVEGGNGSNGSSGDTLSGGTGDDTVRGFGSTDVVSPDPGTDALDGGAGSEDTVSYALVQGGVTVDLASTGPQTNGPIGTDTLAGFEFVLGTGQGDVLSGDGAGNSLLGRGGNDLLNGRGGSDGIAGGDGGDTVSYADAPGGVQVDLTAKTATGASGNDSVTTVENVTGSAFADTLTGDALANSITALGGNDTVSSLAGPDTLDLRDGEADTASCGTELDGVTADQASVDTVNPDCETVAFGAEPDPGGGGEPPAPEDRELSFDLAGKAKQRVVEQKGVIVRGTCPLEACAAVAGGGKLKPRTEPLDPGVAERIKLKLKRKRLEAIAEALEDGRNPKVKVSAEATDAAGNAATDTLTVRAKS